MAIQTSTGKCLLFVGGYTMNLGFVDGRAKGISVFHFDPHTGNLEFFNTSEGTANPSYLAIHPGGRFLYAVNELMEYKGTQGGAISAFRFYPDTGEFVLLNQQPSFGGAPCHVSLDRTCKYAMLTNYMGGNIAIYPILADGSLGEASDMIQHTGSSIDKVRQEKPYAHSITSSPDNRFALVCDLGIDKIMVYQLDLGNGKFIANDPPFGVLHPGAGPRHLDFHPNGKTVYVINELDGTLTIFNWDGKKGTLQEIQTISTLPDGYSGSNSCADVHVHPNGMFAYGSNRGHDSIVIYAVDQLTGRLSLIGHESTRGKTPRSFAIDPSGTFLLAGNQDSSTIITFRIDGQTGKLSYVTTTESPTPVCLKFLTI